MEGIICMYCRHEAETEIALPNAWCEHCQDWADGYKVMPIKWDLKYCHEPLCRRGAVHVNGKCIQHLPLNLRNAIRDKINETHTLVH